MDYSIIIAGVLLGVITLGLAPATYLSYLEDLTDNEGFDDSHQKENKGEIPPPSNLDKVSNSSEEARSRKDVA